ncbi:unnamed protein product [Cuscuta campestris]|uniref:F-box domain-containing protein n=1 Tax=Cuscuta campestris TaxID=132261 RepID=A0A484NDV1_9ASTE|nr:unnamed protein product [Cuscuta campestris]
MKRPHAPGIRDGADPGRIGDSKKAKAANSMEDDEIECGRALASAAMIAADYVLSDVNLLWEVLKRVDGRTLASAACVSRMWKRAAEDERLWEVMCLKDGGTGGLQQRHLSNVVIALGGFRRLYSLHLWPLVKPPSPSAPPCAWPSLPPPPKHSPTESPSGKRRWGKDEMNLSLSLLSIRHFKKMDFNDRSKQT